MLVLKRNTIGAILVASLRLVFGLVFHKLVALTFGPAGTLVFSHIQNLIALVTQPIQDIINQAFINRSSTALKKYKLSAFFSGFMLLTLLTGAFLVFLFIVIEYLDSIILSLSVHEFVLLAVLLLFFVVYVFLTSMYIVKRQLMRLSVIHFSLFALVISLFFLMSPDLKGFLWIYLLSHAITVLVLFIDLRYYFNLKFSKPKKLLDGESKNTLMSFAVMGIGVWVSAKLTDYFVRIYAVENFGTELSGEWQAIVRISDSYKGLIVSFLMMTLFPLLSSHAKSLVQLKSLKSSYKLYIPFIVIALLFYHGQKEFVVEFLYASQYKSLLVATDWIILGDFFALLSFPISILLMANRNTISFFIIELLSAFIFIAALFVLESYGIKSLFYAYSIRFIAYFSVLMIYIYGFNKKQGWKKSV